MIRLFILFFHFTQGISQEFSLYEKLADLNAESQRILSDYQRRGRIVTPQIRSRIVTFMLEVIPIESEVNRADDPILRKKMNLIISRIEKGMRIAYPRLKMDLMRLVSGLLSPVFTPFFLMQPVTLQQEPLTPPPPWFVSDLINTRNQWDYTDTLYNFAEN
uniref:Outer membrane efflux protein n=1 Tax=Heterorhabditis bacteriophora TaxID=37862 RepID=A0A1I7XTF8_HETBA